MAKLRQNPPVQSRVLSISPEHNHVVVLDSRFADTSDEALDKFSAAWEQAFGTPVLVVSSDNVDFMQVFEIERENPFAEMAES